jgi:NAD(P)-dependent dehydrogenase (short-subunit alcohol dehydrogenase family)
LRDRLDEIRERGADLVIIGNGAGHFARAFREELDLDCPILVDPELKAYRAAGMRRGFVEALSPRVPLRGLQAFYSGARQDGLQGDPWQLGGVFVIQRAHRLTYAYRSGNAGDHPPVDDVLSALEADAPAISDATGSAAMPWRVLGRLLTPIVDPTIALSFDRTGFAIHSLNFDPDDLDVDLSTKRCLVTGANSGLGFEIAAALADLGAEVALLCRNAARGEAAAKSIREATGNDRVTYHRIDMSSMDSIRTFADEFGDKTVDVLVHNAGILPAQRGESADGLELTFATHVAGPHLLTRLLRPNLAAADSARVVWVSSGGMYTRKLQLYDYNWRDREFDGTLAYAETKRAQVILSELWAYELRDEGIAVNAMHPGWADTPGVRSSIPNFWRVMRAFLRTPAEGADTAIWLAASPAAAGESGRFFFDRRPRRTHLLPGTGESEAERRIIWTLCEETTADTPHS